MVTTVRRCTSCFCALGTLPLEISTLVIRKLFGARAHLVPSTCWEHILKGEGIHDQPESFVVERGLGLQEPLRENFSSSAGAFAILLYPCFQEFQRNNSCDRWVFFGFVLKIELLVSGFRDLARRWMCEASHSSQSPTSVAVSCAAYLLVMMWKCLQRHTRKHPSEVPVLAAPLLVRWTSTVLFASLMRQG